MMKVLVYVDAENISVEQFNEFLRVIGDSLDSGEMVIGKFYGNHACLGEIMQKCFDNGYEYVDTAAMSGSRKNVTDMKLVVDCMYDVTFIYNSEVSRVYVVSSDHDFVPLAHKLKGHRCNVIMPFLDDVIAQRTCADLSKYLEKINFEMIAKKRLLDNPFYMIRDLVTDEFSDELIDAYVSKKRKRLKADVFEWLGKTKADSIADIPITNFGFQSIVKTLGLSTLDDCLTMFDIYAKKMFGLCLPKQLAIQHVNLIRG